MLRANCAQGVQICARGAHREIPDAGRTDLDLFLSEAEVEIVPVTLEQAELACLAFRHYGRRRHPAGLNFGDVFVTRWPR